MKEEYFSFEFNIQPMQGMNTNAFDNTNQENWFEWQHNELDTDDNYEYNQYFSIRHVPHKYQHSNLAKYEYMKNIQENLNLEQTESNDNSIFYDFKNIYINEHQIRREKSIKQCNSDSISMYRNALISQLRQKRIFLQLVSQNKPRKSLRLNLIEDLDQNIHDTIGKLREMKDLQFLDNMQQEISQLSRNNFILEVIQSQQQEEDSQFNGLFK